MDCIGYVNFDCVNPLVTVLYVTVENNIEPFTITNIWKYWNISTIVSYLYDAYFVSNICSTDKILIYTDFIVDNPHLGNEIIHTK